MSYICSHCFEFIDELSPAWEFDDEIFCEVCIRYEPCGYC